ncbi:FMN-binding protein [Schumannella luteola]
MSARATVGGAVVSGAILALGWIAGAAVPAATTSTVSSGTTSTGSTSGSTSGSTGSTGSSSGSASTGSGSSGSSGSTTATTGATDGTYTGSSVGTRFGNVQVQVTISGGAITDVTAVHLTDHDGKSVQISNRAAPILAQEVLSAQSANVQMVSGATYTSRAYLESLQSALDQAGF